MCIFSAAESTKFLALHFQRSKVWQNKAEMFGAALTLCHIMPFVAIFFSAENIDFFPGGPTEKYIKDYKVS